jgi:type I restriction enzyme S subunit
MTALFPIPASWAWTTLGEIAEVVGGVTKDTKKQSDPALPEVPYLRVANVQRGYLDLREITKIRVPESTLAKLRLQPGDVLLNEGGDRDKLGRGWVWNGQIPNCIHQNHVFRARLPEETVLPRFLAWYINYPARQWFDQHAAQSVNLASISLSTIKQLPVPLPPLDEQDRIVAVLEDHLSRLDAAVVSALAAARKAVALRRRTLADLVAPDSSGSWKKYRLEDVATAVRYGMYVSRPGHEPNGVPILRISAVRSLALDLSDLRYSAKSSEVVQREGYLLRGGDLLFTRYNGNPEYVGACAVVPENLEPLTYPDKLIRVSPDRSLVDPAYLAMACSAGGSRQAIRSAVKTTAGQAGISGGEIKRILLYLPDLDEQRRRAAEFQEHDEAVRHVEENVRSVARRGDYLRRSLLTEAFAGRLVPQDPAEEPASVLLERIRAQLRTRRKPKTAMHAQQEETLL